MGPRHRTGRMVPPTAAAAGVTATDCASGYTSVRVRGSAILNTLGTRSGLWATALAALQVHLARLRTCCRARAMRGMPNATLPSYTRSQPVKAQSSPRCVRSEEKSAADRAPRLNAAPSAGSRPVRSGGDASVSHECKFARRCAQAHHCCALVAIVDTAAATWCRRRSSRRTAYFT